MNPGKSFGAIWVIFWCKNLQKIDAQLTKKFKNNIIISNIKWLIFAIIFAILIGLYYYQSEQIKNSDRSQFMEIERQLENFQTNLAGNTKLWQISSQTTNKRLMMIRPTCL